MTAPRYDVAIVGTGFASSFFLAAYLRNAAPSERILVVERGYLDTHQWQLKNRRDGRVVTSRVDPDSTFVNQNPEKDWLYQPSFGGGSNCWWGNTPRMLPSDFEMHSRYGVGVDWPISYAELEPYYDEVERVMAISGPDDGSPYPRRGAYPQPPHGFTDPDKLLARAYPGQHFHTPTARARAATANRGRCCAAGVCGLCPVDAKFTVLNEMMHVYDDPRVTLVLGGAVDTVDVAGGVAKGLSYTQDGVPKLVQADLVVLGANALFNPHILLRSGLAHPRLGRGLNEQVSVYVTVDLNGVDNYQGSTSITGLGYMQYDGAHRLERAGCLIETHNMPHWPDSLRIERGKWRQRLIMKFVFEDLPRDDNYVKVSDESPELPEVVYTGHSSYTQRSIDALPDILPRLLEPLPTERFAITPVNKTEAHILGTTSMGNDAMISVVDRHLVHHEVRNLLVLGSGAFPVGSPSNPTLTLSALSLWAADHLR